MRRFIQVVLVGAMATPILYLGVWQIVFRLWPSACQAPDGSELLCLVTSQYTQPRDLTAMALSLGFGIVLAAGVYVWIMRSDRRSRLVTRSSSRG